MVWPPLHEFCEATTHFSSEKFQVLSDWLFPTEKQTKKHFFEWCMCHLPALSSKYKRNMIACAGCADKNAIMLYVLTVWKWSQKIWAGDKIVGLIISKYMFSWPTNTCRPWCFERTTSVYGGAGYFIMIAMVNFGMFLEFYLPKLQYFVFDK